MDAIYLARDDAFDVDTWSGSPHWIGRALTGAGFKLDYICPLRGRHNFYYKIKGRLIRTLGWGYTVDGEEGFLKGYGEEATRRVRAAKGGGRLIFSCGKPHLVHLETKLPIVFFDDASMPAIVKTHPGHVNFFPPIKKRLHEAERRVLEKCLYACYASDWAAEGALEYYGKKFEMKIKVIPFGANMEVTRKEEDVGKIIAGREVGACNLLFIGRYWEAKGGPIALEMAKELQKRGVRVRLDVVGCTVPGTVPDYVKVHGFVSKKQAAGQEFLDRLFRESNFLVVPTRFEAYGLVFVEASSYGLPSLASAVGGVTTIVRNGKNGQTFPLEACGAAYADYAQKLLGDPEAYERLSRASFREYEERLNWKTWGEKVRELVRPLFEEVSLHA
jgi:glycosyltransferase involved in cell wall biosynthesis